MKQYDNFSQTFAKSRKNMNWPEIQYFIDYIKDTENSEWKEKKILDIWCWSWRLLDCLIKSELKLDYLWIDSSSWMIDEAKKELPSYDFRVLDMTELDKLEDKFDIIFFVASFHHLSDIYSRLNTLNKAKNLLNEWWIIMMTNWNLLGERNIKKYESSYKWNGDFGIKIWEFHRYYHWFKIEELDKLFIESWFQVIENKFFEIWNNIISILTKK